MGTLRSSFFYANHPPALPVIRSVPLSNVPSMITSTTSNKLAEIIRDTWPNLYRPPADFKPPSDYKPTKDK